jgi:hypothetical protein
MLCRLADSLTSDASLKEHPEIGVEDVRACLSYAYELLDLVGDATQASEDSGCNAGWTDGQQSQERDNDSDDGGE